MSKELKEKLTDHIRSWYAHSDYCLDADGNFVPVGWDKTPDSYFEDDVEQLLAIITSEKIQMLERLLEHQGSVIEHGADFNDMHQYFAVSTRVIESELQKLKEGKQKT